MKAYLLTLWERLRTSYWLVPGLLSLAGLALAAGLIRLDQIAQGRGLAGVETLYIAGPEGARALLATIAGSAITVAGLVFSITMVVLTMASAQFGPRLLRNFMMHNATQVVLGAFIGTFVYCLVALAAVHGGQENVFVPQTAVGGGLVLGIASFALLIYFFHHVSVFVQAPRIIDDVAQGLENALRSGFPERNAGTVDKTPDEENTEASVEPGPFPESGWTTLEAPRSGYVQAIDLDGMLEIARENDLVLRLRGRPGNFAIAGRPAADAYPAERVDDSVRAALAATVFTGPQRTGTQDPEFAVRQLVEVALRALSPSINDPFTAITCIDRLGAALVLLAERALPSRYLRDESGQVRVITDPLTYAGIVEGAFNQIRQVAVGNAAVLIRMLDVIGAIARGDLPRPYREALVEQFEAIRSMNRDRFQADIDRNAFEASCREAAAALGASES